MTTTAEIPAEWVELAEAINARHAAKVAEIAASDYRRTVTLRRDNLEVVLTIAPADSGASWEVNGTGIEYGYGGRNRAGDTRSRYFPDLDGDAGARAYANGWAARLIAQGYRITR